MTQNVPPVRPQSALGGANPFPVTTAKSDPVANELSRLGIATPQPPKSVKARGQTLQLTPDESLKVANEEGRLFSQQLAKIMASARWQRYSDDQKRKVIGELRSKITGQRARRVVQMRDERLSAMDALGRSL